MCMFGVAEHSLKNMIFGQRRLRIILGQVGKDQLQSMLTTARTNIKIQANDAVARVKKKNLNFSGVEWCRNSL